VFFPVGPAEGGRNGEQPSQGERLIGKNHDLVTKGEMKTKRKGVGRADELYRKTRRAGSRLTTVPSREETRAGCKDRKLGGKLSRPCPVAGRGIAGG